MADRLAILIGNGRFEDGAGLANLFGPRHDVSSLGKLLADPEIGDCAVHELLDRGSAELGAELQRLLEMSRRGATLLLYYAGYVVHDAGRGLHLATADTSLADVSPSAVSFSLLRDLLRGSGARQIAVILDCCYQPVLTLPAEEELERSLRRLRLDVDPDLHLIANPARAQSPADREVGTEGGLEGLLTRTIVEGITTGAADRDGDNRICTRELNEYLGMRLGDRRPLWAGPLEGADPEIVANPHPIVGIEPDAFLDEERPAPRRGLFAPLLVALLAVAAVTLLVATQGGNGPEQARLEEDYAGTALPPSVGKVRDLAALRRIIDRTGWIEHVEQLDGGPLRYPSLLTLRVDAVGLAGAARIALRPRQEALIELADGVYAAGFECLPGLNTAEVVVELVDGSRFSFAARTDRAGGNFFGVVSRRPIRRVRIDAGPAGFVVERWYTYADTEHGGTPPITRTHSWD